MLYGWKRGFKIQLWACETIKIIPNFTVLPGPKSKNVFHWPSKVAEIFKKIYDALQINPSYTPVVFALKLIFKYICVPGKLGVIFEH